MIQWIKSLFDRVRFGARSSKWSTFKEWYEETHRKECAVCGNKKVALHHITPFNIDPSKELDSQNVVWLCDGLGTLQHHRGMGHLGSFKSFNGNIREDAKKWRLKIKNRP